MENENNARDLLRQTEAKLREIVSVAAAAGDYAGVVQIAGWAKAVGEIMKATSFTSDRLSIGNVSAPPKLPLKGQRKFVESKIDRRGEKIEYPRFYRQGNYLVRIAWSKRDKKEYRHKSRYDVLQALVKVMEGLGKDGRIFSTENFLPIASNDGNEVPSYQAYVVIALLKHTSLIDQHGRQGYSIPRLPEFKQAVESIWQNLPNK